MEEVNTDVQAVKVKRLRRAFAVLAAVLLLLIIALVYFLLTQRPITKAIPGTPGGAPRYARAIYGSFGDLTGLALNKNGSRLYAVDTSNQKVWIISKNGTVVGSFGVAEKTNEPGGFQAPLFIAVGRSDEIYVTDRQAGRVQVFSPLGKFVKSFEPVTSQADFIWSPLSITTDSKGRIYIADAAPGNHRILILNKNGNILRSFGKEGTGKGEFNYPNGVAVDSAGKVYVADSNNARVQIFSASGKFEKSFSGTGEGSLSHPVGISVAREGEIHVVEALGGLISVFSTQGEPLYTFSSQGLGNEQLRAPQGIAISSDGYVYVADRGNSRVQVWRY